MKAKNKRFADKHPQGTVVAEHVQQAVLTHLSGQSIACTIAHHLAAVLSISPQVVGIAIDLQEGRIRGCQLGLFGYDPDSSAIQPADAVNPQLRAAIESALVDGRLPCSQAWRIADASDLPRKAVAAACEMLKIKISQCQLGAF
jgi:hypothetical protein